MYSKHVKGAYYPFTKIFDQLKKNEKIAPQPAEIIYLKKDVSNFRATLNLIHSRESKKGT